MVATPIIYLIRHGEKPPKLPNGEDADGLSAQGLERANALPQVFGKGSLYNIGHILAEHPKKDGNRSRPYDTVLPLSKNLGLTINDTIDRDDVDGAAKAAKVWTGPGNVLVCWEHGELAKIAEAIGVKNFAKDLNVEHPKKIKYPSDRFDIIWTVTKPYDEIVAVTSEGIKGLDDG
ncbi:hypothetical protein OIDMADRAFT_99361 [Oidiodendron maius Zn]|uniref:Phosphoglycerate mutase family protein n=1 Tax=Oidiodendron maius (strain Zn) TaxID=913774 RepID=A0A0C3D6F5_OIDMZ|nr:hypothetical protein OIDMADRAFT_99361 [Oidiodendron maius Zn]